MSIGFILLIAALIVIIFGLLVFVHELGHFVAAKRAGVEVQEFGFGFPPRLVGIKRSGTVYSINLIPLGGFVKMKGEDLGDRSAGSFGATSFWNKTKILLAGVTMNALLAYAILVGLCLTGLPPILSGQYSNGHPTYKQPKALMAVGVEKDSPAAQADLKRGDLMLMANGQPLTSEDDLLNFTKSHAGQKVTFTVSHHHQNRTITPILKPASAKQGFLGVTPLQTYKLQYDLPHSLVTAAGILVQLVWGTLLAFGGLVSSLLIHHQPGENVTGPVGIVVILSSIVDLGVAYVLIFVASISVSLAVINAMPLPALDGGRWALALVQRISGKALTATAEAAVHTAGFAVLLLLMAIVTFFDIRRFG